MKTLITLFLLPLAINLAAQIPVSHDPAVSFTHSGSYYAAGGAATNNFIMCDSWNSGTYGGWLQMDLNTNITLESLRWWVGMVPNGNVTSEIIQVSADGVNWTEAANTSGWHYLFQEIKLEFDPVIPNVRYIRIDQSGTPSWFSIPEMIVNNPFYADNIYTNLPPKILDNLGNELTEPISSFPYTYKCSKALTYQWYKDGVLLPGETNQEYTATVSALYACAVTYSTANCGYATTSEPTLPAPLPIELAAFNVIEQNNDALLSWEVASLRNFSHFEIQRSTDGFEFQSMGNVEGSDIGSYRFTDVKPPAGIHYYRLKMVDNDGSYEHSELRWLRIEDSEFLVYPNPVQDLLHIHSAKEQYRFYIYDMLGNLFYKGESHEKNSRLAVAHFPKGLYCIKLDHPIQGDMALFLVE